MKTAKYLLKTTLVVASLLTLGWATRVEARTLVACGPGGAARIVEKVPIGCHVLKVNSPPKQAGNT